MTAIHPVEFFNIQAIYIAPMFLMDIHAGDDDDDDDNDYVYDLSDIFHV